MNAHSRRSSLAGAFAVIALLAGACGTTTDEPEETVTVTTTSTSATSETSTTTSAAEPEPPQPTTASPAAPAPSSSAAPQAPPPQAAGPQIGDFCMGADIGRKGVDAAGTAIVCDNYEWRPDVGQRPSHPWVDDQVAFMECLEEFTQEECREMLN